MDPSPFPQNSYQFSLLKSSKILLHPPFSKGEKAEGIFHRIPKKALLPLKKGGREGFLARPFQSAKVLPKL
jgi:hypothetical protein